MRRAFFILMALTALASISLSVQAQSTCDASGFSKYAAQAVALRAQLSRMKADEMEMNVPPNVALRFAQLKQALVRTTDAALSCSQSIITSSELQTRLAQILHANAPEPASGPALPKSLDHEELYEVYGQNLKVEVKQLRDIPKIIAVHYSMDIECGDDSVLLVYELQDHRWTPTLRWQSPQTKEISDGFGDFFVFAFVKGETNPSGQSSSWRLVVAHGTPWCTSRFSGFAIDLVAAAKNPDSPQVLWHMERGYSRGDFAPTLKADGDAFELRLNKDCMSFDLKNCFERRAIYRYEVNSENHVLRTNPLAFNARGFVSEWLESPWSESQLFSAADSRAELKEVHETFDPPAKASDNAYITSSYGPVLACAEPKTFQVQMNSTLEKIVPGKPGGEQYPLASRYFKVRELKDGYVVLAAPTKPEPSCSGKNLMPDAAR